MAVEYGNPELNQIVRLTNCHDDKGYDRKMNNKKYTVQSLSKYVNKTGFYKIPYFIKLDWLRTTTHCKLSQFHTVQKLT